MDEKLQELLNELYKELGVDANTNNTTQQATTYQAQEQSSEDQEDVGQASSVDYNQLQASWDYWKQLGRSAFLSMSIANPNIVKYMPLIEQRAEYKLQQDLAKNQIKDSYLQYLQEAYNDIQKELADIVKDFLQSRQVPYYGYMAPAPQEVPTYTMKDYRNDYKKALEYVTYKDIGEIYYKDSSDKGKYGEGKLKLGEPLQEINL